MFGFFIPTERLRQLLSEDFTRHYTPVRGVFVAHNDKSRHVQIMLCGTNPGTDTMGPIKHARELAMIRAELPRLGVEEVFFADFDYQGYVLVVEPTEPLEKSETIADGCWTFTPGSDIKLGRLLKELSALTWRGWEEGFVPQIAQQLAEEDDPAEDPQSEQAPSA